MHVSALPTKIIIDAYVGYRVWEVSSDGRLLGVMSSYEWPVRRPSESEPLVRTDDSDEGFCAWTTARDAWREFDELLGEASYLHLVVGSVALWGDVTIEDDGSRMRARRAYPISLFETWDPETNAHVQRAGRSYAVDVMSCPIIEHDVPCLS